MKSALRILGAVAGTLLAAGTAAAEPQAGRTLTVYQGGFGLVTETRSVHPGNEPVIFKPVSPMIDPATVLLTSPSPVTVREQVFLPPTLNHAELLRAHTGKEVLLIRIHPTTGEEIVEKALVLEADSGPVLQVNGRIETSFPGRISFPGLPPSLTSDPALRFVLAGDGKTIPVTVSYLSQGFGWKAEYVALLSEDRSRLALTAFASLENQTGIPYSDSRLRFIAGQVNRLQPGQRGIPRSPMRPMEAKIMSAESDVVGEAVEAGEYYLYEVLDPVDVLPGATQQFGILKSDAVRVESATVLQSHVSPYPAAREEQRNLHPSIQLTFENTKANGLQKPLPAGTVRFYQASQGEPTFLGEDRLGATAAGGKVELKPGQAFDVSIHRKQVAFERLAPTARRDDRQPTVLVTYALEISNAGADAKIVSVEELIPGEWRITEESFEHSKPAAGVARWRLRVGGNETKTLRYQARIQL